MTLENELMKAFSLLQVEIATSGFVRLKVLSQISIMIGEEARNGENTHLDWTR